MTQTRRGPARPVPTLFGSAWSGWCLALVGLMLLLLPGVARAQENSPSLSGALAGGGLTLTLDKFGVGNTARLGDTAGIRLVVVDTSATNRSVLIRLGRRDPDGDTIEAERVITTNPGVQQGVWFYTRVPYDYQTRGPDSQLVATAYLAIENDSQAEGAPDFVPGRPLARLTLDPKQISILKRTLGLIGTTGSATMGLNSYSSGLGNSTDPWSPGRGEATELVTGIQVADMPDQWHGWASYETLVWTRGEPGELKGERARAIREWVQRGGHLVIVLPPVGQTWTNRQSNELFSILPAVSIQRSEGIDLEPYRPILLGRKEIEDTILIRGEPTRAKKSLDLPSRAVVHTFTPTPDAGAGDAIRIINGPDGACVVVRRLVGLGCVTLVGIDVSASSMNGLVDPQAFWHRILGKQGRVPQGDDVAKATNIGGSPRILDMGISRELNERQQGKSATGLLLGFILFILYWLVAGPIGFAILKRRGQSAHAWVGFFVSAVAFTAIAWAGATTLRPKRIEVSHITLFDHVYGQDIQRSRTFASILLPGYGDATVRVGAPDAAAAQEHTWDFLSPWETSDDDARPASFPDARGYRVDARTPDSLRVPTRATVKEFVADWAGGNVLRMPYPDTDGAGDGATIRWLPPEEGKAAVLAGVLKHDLPGDLREVRLIIVRAQEDFAASGNAPRPTWFGRTEMIWVGDWPAGSSLDLALQQKLLNAKPKNIGEFLRLLVPPPPRMEYGFGGQAPAEERPTSKLLAAMLTPLLPVDDTGAGMGTTPTVALRSATHGWDLARWFTHPCLIIVGELDGPTPTPIFVDGQAVGSAGKTYIRWVYPLPDSPPDFSRLDEPTYIRETHPSGSGGK